MMINSNSKNVNLTIRLPKRLKLNAEQAALSLDLSLSQVIRRALKALVEESDYSAKSKKIANDTKITNAEIQ